MRVELAVELFPNPPSTVQLDALAFLALQSRHRVLIADDTDPGFRDWFQSLSSDHRDEWELILADAYETEAREPAQRSVYVTRDGPADWKANPPRLPLDQAVDFLQLPFLAILEDWSSDRGFLFAVATPEQRQYLARMEDKGALQFDNGGGISNMPKRISKLVEREGNQLRLWALFDGDALQPGVPSEASERLRTCCADNSVPHHQLTRRNIENYITPGALQTWATGAHRAERTRRVRSFLRMTEPQRFHFNMKNGFAKDAKRTDATAGSLFDTVPPKDLQTLASGFGDQIGHLLNPALIHEADLRGDSSWDELSGMVAALVAAVR